MNDLASQNFTFISKLPLFANLEKKQLQEILKNAQIVSYKKGKILFSAAEKILNFYVVIDGMIKLFINDFDGEETILKIIDRQKSVSDIFCDYFQSNAQVVEDAKILVIPTQQIKDLIKNNFGFALNVLHETSAKNKELLNQLIQLKLTNSKQKVGQFLLGMAFEKNNGKTKTIRLKCDKSLIASYLGIKPETFSRSLQKLKDDEEITVKKDEITLLHNHSLCNYCSNEFSQKCDHRKSTFCQQNF